MHVGGGWVDLLFAFPCCVRVGPKMCLSKTSGGGEVLNSKEKCKSEDVKLN